MQAALHKLHLSERLHLSADDPAPVPPVVWAVSAIVGLTLIVLMVAALVHLHDSGAEVATQPGDVSPAMSLDPGESILDWGSSPEDSARPVPSKARRNAVAAPKGTRRASPTDQRK